MNKAVTLYWYDFDTVSQSCGTYWITIAYQKYNFYVVISLFHFQIFNHYEDSVNKQLRKGLTCFEKSQ